MIIIQANTVFEGNVNPLQYSWPGKSHGQRNLAGCSPWGSQRVGYDLVTNGPWVGKILWRMEWLPTPVFLPEEFHEQRSLAAYSPWGREESNTTEQRSLSLKQLQQQHRVTYEVLCICELI